MATDLRKDVVAFEIKQNCYLIKFNDHKEVTSCIQAAHCVMQVP